MTDSLYGTKDPSKTKHKPISSSTSLAFSSNLSALISSTKPSTTTTSRPRPSNSSKSSIFTTHNKNVKKRSLADMQDQDQQHKTKYDIGAVSSADLHRSKRKMEEKVRLYNAMKRGEYIGREDQTQGLVDFDREMGGLAHTRISRLCFEQGSDNDSDSERSDDSNDNSKDQTAQVEYLDEFGRLRKGTPAEAKREQRKQQLASAATAETTAFSAHPQRPTNLIYGDTVQHQAFNPDRIVAEKMEELAKKRDKSATPPPETHYDATAEIRNRGTGFYAFSSDADLRKEEMEGLERRRVETERLRREREEAREKRKKEIEERRRLIAEKRSRKEADRFLDGLELDVDAT